MDDPFADVLITVAVVIRHRGAPRVFLGCRVQVRLAVDHLLPLGRRRRGRVASASCKYLPLQTMLR